MTYRFCVGIRPMNGMGWQICCDVVVALVGRQKLRATHACFLLEKDIFEYSLDGWRRRKGVGRDQEFDWKTLGHVQGTTHVSPDKLETAIRNGEFIKEIYGPYHNCHAFVRECLRLVGADFFYKDYRKMVMETCSRAPPEWLRGYIPVPAEILTMTYEAGETVTEWYCELEQAITEGGDEAKEWLTDFLEFLQHHGASTYRKISVIGRK